MKLALCFLLAAAAPADPAAREKAGALLAQARHALGGKIAEAPRGVSLEADLRRVQPVEGGEARDMSGELTVDAQLPDRYLKVETLTPFPGAPAFSLGTGIDGEQAWRAPVGVAAGPHMVLRVAEAGGAAGAGTLRRRARAEMLRLLLLAFAAAPADGGLTFVHGGEAEAPEGRADRIEVSDGEGLLGTLFVDQATHRPLFVSFRTQPPRLQMMSATSREEAEHLRARAEAPAAAPREAEARLFVSDWKVVDGVLLPHRVSQTIEGGPTEEWTIRRWKLDPTFKPGHFKKP